MAKPITEIFDEINADPKAIEKYKGNAALRMIFEYAFDPAKKMILPEGDPPFKPTAEPLGMTPANLYQELRRLYVFCRADLSPLKREGLFIGFLEGIHPLEAKLILAVKDQTLDKLYPKVTHKLAFENGFIDIEPPKAKTAKKASAPKTGTKTTS
jgi:hypothetical protein